MPVAPSSTSTSTVVPVAPSSTSIVVPVAVESSGVIDLVNLRAVSSEGGPIPTG